MKTLGMIAYGIVVGLIAIGVALLPHGWQVAIVLALSGVGLVFAGWAFSLIMTEERERRRGQRFESPLLQEYLQRSFNRCESGQK